LSDAEKLQLSANDMGAALNESYGAAEITVAGRIGTWDAEQARVVAIGATGTTISAVTLPAAAG
jgi:hypothetical protein